MIHFNELYVTEDGKHLVVDAEIDDISVYDSCYIDKITVDVGENCEFGGNSNNALVLFEDYNSIPGDQDNDGKITKKDWWFWYRLMELASYPDKLEQREDGSYYYNGYIIDDEYNLIQNQDGDFVTGEVDVPKKMVTLLNRIHENYPDIVLRDGTSPRGNALTGHLLSYIADILGPSFTTSTASGDLNGDGQTNIADINTFIAYLWNASEGNVDTYVRGKKVKHFRKCFDVNDLVPLVEVNSNLSSKLFIVTVHAGCYGDTTELMKAECGYDIPEITGVAYNGKPLYDGAVNAAASYGNTCDNNDARTFMDYVLRYYGFLFALKSGDLCQAQYYWENFLNRGGSSMVNRNYQRRCGCHGIL